MSLIDFFLGPLYFILLLIIANGFKNRMAKSTLQSKYFIRIFLFKLFAVTFFAFIYQFYYRGGDTMVYYDCSDRLASFMIKNPFEFIKLVFFNARESFYLFAYDKMSVCNYFLKYNSREFAFVKIIHTLNVLALNSYLSLSYILTFCSFYSNWKLFQVFNHFFPKAEKKLLFSTMLIPSVAFWGTGILKDTITFIFMCLLIYAVFKLFIKREKLLISIIVIIVSVYIITIIKGYVIIALIPAIGVWLYTQFRSNIQSSGARIIATPIILVVVAGGLYFLFMGLQSSFNKFSLDRIEDTAESFQRWHTVASEDGSGYNLNIHDFSPSSIIFAIPKTFNVTFFRPYLWEVSSPVVFLSALESLFIFFYFIRILIKGRFVRFFGTLFSSPILQFCLIFSIIFSLMVGLTSYNFGALSRYKIPVMPIFVTMMVIIDHQLSLKSKRE